MSSILAKENLIFTIGDTWRRRIIFDTDEDLSTWTAKMQVRSEAGAADLVLELSTGNGRITMGSNYADLEVAASVVPDLSAVSTEGRLSEASDDCSAPSSAYGKLAVADLRLYSPDATPEEFTPVEFSIVFRTGVTADA